MVEIAFRSGAGGPPPGGPYCKVDYPPPGGRVTGWITSHRIVQVDTHYLDQLAEGKPRTIPHVTPEVYCEGCRRHCRILWKGYVGCWDNQFARPFIAEITAEAARQEKRLVSGQDLRGMLLTLWRPGRNKRGRVYASLGDANPKVDLPPPLNVVMLLCRLWGYADVTPAHLRPAPEEGGGQ